MARAVISTRWQFQRRFDALSEVQMATCKSQLSIATSKDFFTYVQGLGEDATILRVKMAMCDRQRGINSS